MPSHTHSQNSHSHSWSGYRVLFYNYSETGQVGVGERGLASSSGNYKVPSVNSSKTNWVGADTSGGGTATNNNTGGGGAHNQMPPFLSVNYIIYAG